MTHCWNAEPKDRPDFMEIADIIGALLEANVRQVSNEAVIETNFWTECKTFVSIALLRSERSVSGNERTNTQ
jgi:hypothetical protein